MKALWICAYATCTVLCCWHNLPIARFTHSYRMCTPSELYTYSFTMLYSKYTIMCTIMVTWMKKIPYSGKLSWEKFWRIWKKRFLRSKLSRIAHWCHQKMPHPQILWRKLSWIPIKPRNSQKFSPSKVSHYMVLWLSHDCVNMLLCSC